MKITIERVTNGYVVSCPDFVTDESGADNEVTKSLVIEEKEIEFGEQEAFVMLCYELLDQFGIDNNKHNRRQINIELTDEEE